MSKMKKNKSMKRLFGMALCLLLALSVLSSCASREGNNGNESETETDEVFTQAEDKGKTSELGKRYSEYRENMSLAFGGYEPLGDSAFEYEIVDGKVRITKYIGEESIIVIPEKIAGADVAVLASSAFSGGKIGAVYVPDSVESIELGAFEACEALTTLRIPIVGDGGENQYLGYIFGADEPDKNAVTVPGTLDMVIIGSGCNTVADEAFRGIKTLSAVVFEGEVSSIGDMAFYQCSDLVMVTLDNVTGDIGELAFAFCSSLFFADISNCEDVESGAFYLCTSMNGMKLNFSDGEYLGRFFGAVSPDYNDEFVPTSLRSVAVGDRTKKIPDRAFTACKYLTDISLPETLETIGVRAFYACRSLVELKFPNSLKVIDDDAFFGCDNLKTVEFGSSLESIGMQAFYGCVSLEKADVREGVKAGSGAFGNCPKLK